MTAKLILEVIVAIPSILKMLQSLFKTVQVLKEETRQTDLARAISESKAASSIEAAKAANEQVTRNLP